jgi:hypothetical protein
MRLGVDESGQNVPREVRFFAICRHNVIMHDGSDVDLTSHNGSFEAQKIRRDRPMTEDMTKVLRRFRRALRARQGVSYCAA